jgi:hypothetical protein
MMRDAGGSCVGGLRLANDLFFSFWFPVIDFWRWALCPPHQILINNDIVGEADVLSVSGKCFFTPQKIYYGGGY